MKKFSKLVLGASFALMTVAPALANMTDLTISADVNPMLAIQLETVAADPIIVSKDDDDPQPGSPAGANEVLDFGTVTPLAITTGTFTSTNGTTGTLKAMVVDTGRTLYNYNNTNLPTTTNDDAIYFVENALQVRTFKTGAVSTADITVENDAASALSAICEKEATLAFAESDVLPAGTYMAPGVASLKTLQAANPNGGAVPIDVGIKVPFSASGTDLLTKLVFTAI